MATPAIRVNLLLVSKLFLECESHHAVRPVFLLREMPLITAALNFFCDFAVCPPAARPYFGGSLLLVIESQC
jgi:hypothetical protein